MNLNFDKRLFNDLFFELEGSDKRYNVIWGGAGSGKSFSTAQHLVKRLLGKKQKALVVRQFQTSLNESVIDLIVNICEDWSNKGNFQIITKHNKVEKKIDFFNGSQIIFKGLDDVSKLKSVNNVSCIWIEEADEIDELSFFQLDARVRGKSIVNPKIFISFNPVHESHWLKKHFFDNVTVSAKVDFFHSTYHNNKFIDTNYKEVLEGYKFTNPNFYQVYCLGEWGVTNTEANIYKAYDATKHVTYCEFNPLLPLWVSLDENYVPTSSMLICQVENDTINIIDEIFEIGWNLEQICNELNDRYGNHPKILTGDRTSNKGDSKQDRGATTFTIVEKWVNNIINTRLPSQNPQVGHRVNWLNKVMSTDEVKVRINPRCKNLINDLMNVKWDKDNKGKDKSVFKDKKYNITYQKFGHLSDCFDYVLVEAFRKKYDAFMNVGGRLTVRYRVKYEM